MRRTNSIIAFAFVGLATFLFFAAGRLNFGNFRVPQTGFFPKILIGLLLVLALVLLAQAMREPENERVAAQIPAEGWFRIGSTLATLVGFALVLERLGFLLSTFLLMVLLLRAIEAPRWPKVVVVALVTALVSYGLFAWLLGVPLPTGALGI